MNGVPSSERMTTARPRRTVGTGAAHFPAGGPLLLEGPIGMPGAVRGSTAGDRGAVRIRRRTTHFRPTAAPLNDVATVITPLRACDTNGHQNSRPTALLAPLDGALDGSGPAGDASR